MLMRHLLSKAVDPEMFLEITGVRVISDFLDNRDEIARYIDRVKPDIKLKLRVSDEDFKFMENFMLKRAA